MNEIKKERSRLNELQKNPRLFFMDCFIKAWTGKLITIPIPKERTNMDKIVCLGGCGCNMTSYPKSEQEFPICIDCFICPECGSHDPYGKAARKEICPTCRRELPNQKERIINFHCDECGKTWKTQGAFLRRYKQRIEFVKKYLKENT